MINDTHFMFKMNLNHLNTKFQIISNPAVGTVTYFINQNVVYDKICRYSF